MVAKLKYDGYVKAVEALDKEIDSMEDRLSTYESIMDDYLQIIKMKEKKDFITRNRRG